ncbi:MAG: hypothetical protein VXZ96_20130 [Myxococcota bacterium]|nr:hypothetical protein [Myxococcota bacterium]
MPTLHLQTEYQMLQRLTDEWSLALRNLRGRLGLRDPRAQGHVVVKNVLPAATFSKIKQILQDEKSRSVEQNSFFRRGSAFDGTDLRANCPEVVDALVSDALLRAAREQSGLSDLSFVPDGDVNQISLLHYRTAGDGIGWHVDGNIYIGQRWAGILTIEERTEDLHSKLELRPNGQVLTFPVSELENTLILFQGDQVQHRVRPMADGEERLVINLLLTTDPRQSVNPFLKGYQSLVNYFFYGRLRSGFQIEDDFSASKSKPNVRY